MTTKTTTAMQAKAQQLAFESTTWNHGRSKVDGTTFYVVPASDGKSAHYSNTFGCTCRSYRHRGACSHVEACKLIQRERDAKITAIYCCSQCGAAAVGKSRLCPVHLDILADQLGI